LSWCHFDRSTEQKGRRVLEAELSAGPISYEDSGGEGRPAIVLCHGLLMSGALWDEVVAELSPGLRCLCPTFPMGAHRTPMRPDADLSLVGQVRLLVEFLAALELEDVTLVFNDWCGAQIMIAENWDERVGRIVFASCETYDNYPPGLPGKLAALAAAVPGGVAGLVKPLRLRAVRQLPFTFGNMSKRRVPDQLFDRWLEPASRRREIRADLRKYAGDTRAGRAELVAANGSLGRFSKPVLVAWAAEDRVMPRESGQRLAASFPNSRWIEIPDSRTLIPIDQPGALARAIASFVSESIGED
jgi:pimeloyl-ACP methyl ester carboxylesterase